MSDQTRLSLPLVLDGATGAYLTSSEKEVTNLEMTHNLAAALADWLRPAE